MDYNNQYEKWLTSEIVDEVTKSQLRKLRGQEDEIKEIFSSMLDFGTAGLRGLMGPGLNRMNVYTVRYATQGLCDLILESGPIAAKKGVCIAYDSRICSEQFAWEAACTLSTNGISVYIFDELRPTPELSFAIREFGAIAGINITASHNPKEYNGFKVYWEDGAQLPPQHAKQISERLTEIDIFLDVLSCEKEVALQSGLITIVGKEFDELYIKQVLAESVGKSYVKEAANSFRMVYSPIHGTGYRLVPEVLKRLGMNNVLTVREQMEPDGSFPTTKSPNPEERAALELAIKLAEKENIDLIVGTDPDCDRVGIVVRNSDGKYVTVTGNQLGVLLIDYLIQNHIEQGTLKENAVVIKSIVSTNMARKITEHYGVHTLDVLTGFKYIGEKIKEFEATNEYSFLFGFEESNGYLAGTYARDKDAVVASMLIAEMACYYRLKNMSLYDALQELFERFGFFEEHCESITISGLYGVQVIKSIMNNLRKDAPKTIADIPIVKVRDYQSGFIHSLVTGENEETGLPNADVLFYELEDGTYIVVRPSGTEPKLKLYIMTQADSRKEALRKKELFVEECKYLVEKLSENDILI